MSRITVGIGLAAVLASVASASEFGPAAAHSDFREAFNARDWDTVRALLADDVVFQRATSTDVHSSSTEVSSTTGVAGRIGVAESSGAASHPVSVHTKTTTNSRFMMSPVL